MSVQSSEPTLVHHASPLLKRDNNDNDDDHPKTALILLNSPLGSMPSPLFQHLWENVADVRICADGGANRLYDATFTSSSRKVSSSSTSSSSSSSSSSHNTNNNNWIPDMIVGDLDSLKTHVRDYYQEAGASIQKRPDQDSNDLDKAVTAAVEDAGCQRCLVFGAFGGRFDQEMASLQALYKWASSPPPQANKRPQALWLYDDQTMAFLLPANVENRIELALPATTTSSNSNSDDDTSTEIGEGPTCGLIPLGGPCSSVTTAGFQWNLQDQPTEFGGLVSTSNRILSREKVTVRAASPLVFTAEVHCGRTNSWSSPSSNNLEKKTE